MAQRFGSYGVTAGLVLSRSDDKFAHTQLAVVDFGDTFSALCLSGLANVLQQRTDLFWIGNVVGGSVRRVRGAVVI